MLASYAAAAALNSFLPANIGTWVMLLRFTTLFAGATFPMMVSGIFVQKIPFTVFNLALYLYLFLSVAGSFSVKLGFLADHTGLAVAIVLGGVVLLFMLARVAPGPAAGRRTPAAARPAVAVAAAPGRRDRRPQWIGTAIRGASSAAARAARSGSMWPGPSVGPQPQTGSRTRSSGPSSAMRRGSAQAASTQLCPVLRRGPTRQV